MKIENLYLISDIINQGLNLSTNVTEYIKFLINIYFSLNRFLTVFLCLFFSVVVTMPEYERIATIVLLPSVKNIFSTIFLLFLFILKGDNSFYLAFN